MSTAAQAQLIALLTEFSAKVESATGARLEIPPKSVGEMRTEYVRFEPSTRLAARFPFDPRFTNPAGMFQGGMIGAAFDNVFGPLSYLAAERPCVTIEMSVSYVRPFFPKDEYLEIEVWVTAKTRQLVVMAGEAKNSQGKLVATATTHCLVMDSFIRDQVTVQA